MRFRKGTSPNKDIDLCWLNFGLSHRRRADSDANQPHIVFGIANVDLLESEFL